MIDREWIKNLALAQYDNEPERLVPRDQRAINIRLESKIRTTLSDLKSEADDAVKLFNFYQDHGPHMKVFNAEHTERSAESFLFLLGQVRCQVSLFDSRISIVFSSSKSMLERIATRNEFLLPFVDTFGSLFWKMESGALANNELIVKHCLEEMVLMYQRLIAK